jgi:DNA-binding NtrC family response regulator
MHKARNNLLIVDDDRIFTASLREYLQDSNIEVHVVHTAAECLALCSSAKIDVVLLDQKLPDMEGHALCPSILDHNDQTKIIFTTAFPSFDNAVKAVRAGAFDYLSKPFELEELDLAVKRAVRTLALEKVEQFQNYQSDKESEENVLIGNEDGLSAVRRLITLASTSDAPVLITGETGTGKNITARSIHYRSPLKNAPFICINCAAIPENLIEAELFGCEKGAFTGAVSARKGLFEMADGGTLFLDEIGEMPAALQSKLLGVLDDGKIRRLGGSSTIELQVRTIAATSVDLEQAIKKKTFRNDLYYRLSVIKIHMPPLRERRNDIPLLCDFLLKKVAKGKKVSIAENEIEKLKHYPWPGSVRELRNVLERAVLLRQGPEIRPSEFLTSTALQPSFLPAGLLAKGEPSGFTASLDNIEREHIKATLAEHGGNFSRTARAIGISLSTLKRKIKKYDINKNR